MDQLNRDQLNSLAAKFAAKLGKIKLFLVDADGILTTGHVYYHGQEIGFNRFFHVADGYGIKMLRQAGIKVGIISGGESKGLVMRSQNPPVDFCGLGNEDKRRPYLEAQEKFGFTDEQTLYMGDELFDGPLLRKAGFSATAPAASYEIKEICDYVTTRASGMGCVREVIDILRIVQDIRPHIPDF